jgi:2',3'-cyclic-nucleotide 2'-phosphodiesterase (5'-nucleotidase family)
MSISRRTFLTTTMAGAACVVSQSPGYSVAEDGESRRLTLLHVTDTHAQLETHPEYLPGDSPELQMMGGFARLMRKKGTDTDLS